MQERMTIGEAFAEAVAVGPDATALRFGERTWTYAELAGAAQRAAGGLAALGVRRGDRVSVLSTNCPEHVIVQLAAAHLGAIAAPVNHQWMPNEAAGLLEHTEPKVLVLAPTADQAMVSAARLARVPHLLAGDLGGGDDRDTAGQELPPFSSLLAHDPCRATTVDPDDAAVIWHTSGTTGRPKGAVWTHHAFLNNSRDLAALYGVRSGMASLSVFPHAHNGAGITTFGPLLLHGQVELLSRADTTLMLDRIQSAPVGFLATAIPVLRLLQGRMERLGLERLPQLESIVLGAASTSNELLDWVGGIAPNAKVYFAYGASEGYGTIADTSRRDKLGSVGLATPGAEVAILDQRGDPLPPNAEGRVALRGPGMMTGYWRDLERTGAAFHDGWCSWGDVGLLDEDGWLWLFGRDDGVLNTGGYKVHAGEVESVIAEVPGVTAVAVMSRPHAILGEELIAFVASSDPEVTRDAVTRAVNELLAAYKRPAAVFVLDTLPVNSLGKVQKHLIRDQAPDTFQ